MTTEDRAAIEKAVENWMAAWERKDAHLAVQDYAEDADWTNVFGVRCRSRAELETTLTQIFSSPFAMAGRDTVVGQEVRFLRSDVALVRTRVERRGQLMPSGEPMGTRHTTHLRVFELTEVGWKVVSHLISDARDQERPQH
ncbi:MAG TPA: SgcJ/EcaC family oxidoreductase [Actinomycetota bacterium]|nr:SgcJ/EcaC family oxidoreductase [Actinomycetota bacterium]